MNIALVGYGVMGQNLVEAIGFIEELTIVGVVDKMSGLGVNSFDELTIQPSVIIDFSHPSYLPEMLEYAIKNKIALVIATTGYTATDIALIEDASNQIPIVYTANTSLGVNVLKKILRTISPLLSEDYDIEIVEKHHNQKLDAPSGTAKQFVNEILSVTNKDYDIVYGRQGNQKRSSNEIGVHSLRGGTVVGEHSIYFYGEDEVIEIKHQANSKQVFTKGAIKAALYVNEKENGLYSMSDVLFEGE